MPEDETDPMPEISEEAKSEGAKLFVALLKYITLDTLRDAKDFLINHAELLDERMPDLIPKLIGSFNDRPDMMRRAKERQLFLEDCSRRGIVVAWIDWKNTPMKRIKTFPNDVLKKIANSLENGFNDDFVAIVGTYPDLNTILTDFVAWEKNPANNNADELERIFEELDSGYSGQEEKIQLYQAALKIMMKDDDYSLWATLHRRLGLALINYETGDQDQDKELGIQYLETGLDAKVEYDTPVDKAIYESNLALAYLSRQKGDPQQNIEHCISLIVSSLKFLTKEDNEMAWATLQLNLAVAYWRRETGSRTDNVKFAITCCQEALTLLTPETDLSLYSQAKELLKNCRLYLLQSGHLEFSSDNVTFLQETLKTVDPQKNAFSYVALQEQLGLALLSIQTGDHADNLERAIKAFEDALTYCDSKGNTTANATLQGNLGNVYIKRIHGDRSENIEKAISLIENGLTIISKEENPIYWAALKSNLATAYSDRQKGSQADNLEMAIDCCKDALNILSPDEMPDEWSSAQSILGGCYLKRHLGSRSDNIEKALAAFEASLIVIPAESDPVKWAALQHNLGTVFAEREKGGIAENKEFAIHAFQRALSVLNKNEHPHDWGETKINLATVFQGRTLGNRKENVQMAIRCYLEASEIFTQSGNPEKWASIIYNVSILEQQTNNHADAIESLRLLEMTTSKESNPHDWGETMHELGMAYSDISVSEPDYMKKLQSFLLALYYFEKSLEVRQEDSMPTSWATTQIGMGIVYFKMSGMNDPVYSTESSREDLFELGKEAIHNSLKVFSINHSPKLHQRANFILGKAWFKRRDWQQALTCFENALQATDLVYEAAVSPATRHLALKDSANLPAMTAYCYVKNEQPDKAITVLERAKARYLAEMLSRTEAELGKATPDDLSAFKHLTYEISLLERKTRNTRRLHHESTEVFNELHHYRNELGEIVKKIRTYLPDFMPLGLNIGEMTNMIDQINLPLIYLFASHYGSIALMITPREGVKVILIDDISQDSLEFLLHGENFVGGYIDAIVSGEAGKIRKQLGTSWQKICNSLMHPICSNLRDNGFTNSFLIAEGLLSLLPLPSPDPAISFAQIPSAHALQSCILSKKRREEKFVNNKSNKLFCLANPITNLPSLIFSDLEIDQVGRQFKGYTIEIVGGDVSPGKILASIDHTTHLHFSCHGIFNEDDPLESALVLSASERLTLAFILDGKLPLPDVKFCFLCACQTSLTDFNNTPNEAIGFPTALLIAGIPGIVGTLWSVNDLSTALFSIKFYEFYRKYCFNHDGPVKQVMEAVSFSQNWLRNVTNGELSQLFDDYKLQSSGHLTLPIKNQFERFVRSDPDEKPFAHPYFWAPFVLFGL